VDTASLVEHARLVSLAAQVERAREQ